MGGAGNVTLGSCPPSTRSAPGCAASKCPPQQGRLCLGDKLVFVALLPPAWHGSVSPPLLLYTGPARRPERLPVTFWAELLHFPFFLTFSKYLIHQKVTAQNSIGCEMSSHLHRAAGNRIEVRGTPVTCARCCSAGSASQVRTARKREKGPDQPPGPAAIDILANARGKIRAETLSTCSVVKPHGAAFQVGPTGPWGALEATPAA